jgi:hypothetical protein
MCTPLNHANSVSSIPHPMGNKLFHVTTLSGSRYTLVCNKLCVLGSTLYIPTAVTGYVYTNIISENF